MGRKKRLSKGWVVIAGFVVFVLLRTSLVFADSCLADINNDGKVDGNDLMMLKTELGRENCYTEPCESDFNGDGKVNDEDVEVLKAEFNRHDCLPGGEVVPGEEINLFSIEQETEFFTGEEEVPYDTDVGEEVEDDEPLPTTRFKDNEDATVTDPDTGLMWTKNADLYEDTLLFHQALAYIKAMNEGVHPNFGYTDWRLPVRDELRSLIDYTKLTMQGHTLPLGHPFDNVQSMNPNGRAITYLYTTDHSWFVSLYCRLVGHNVTSCYGYVWPVRGGN